LSRVADSLWEIRLDLFLIMFATQGHLARMLRGSFTFRADLISKLYGIRSGLRRKFPRRGHSEGGQSFVTSHDLWQSCDVTNQL